MPMNATDKKIKSLESVLIKPAGADCNLNCAYCFYLDKGALYPDSPRHRMSDEVLEALVRQVMHGGGERLNFGWQGGEPTLMGLDFFRRATQLQRRFGSTGQVVCNGLQTNGMLLDESWAEFFNEYQFLIGLSLDGPELIHDHYRRNRGGEPTWARVDAVAHLLLKRGVAVNALSVISDFSARQPDALYDYLKSLGLNHMQFIPCVEPLPDDPTALAPFSVPPQAFGEFLCRIFDRWLGDFREGQPTTFIRWIDSLFHTYVGLPAPECTLMPECGCYVAVEHNGDVYACDFFVEPEWKLGNLLETDLIELLNAPRQEEFGRQKATLGAACTTCRWLTRCWGGCLKDRRHNPASPGISYFCRAYKMFFEHADPQMKQMAARWIEQERRREIQETRRGGGDRPAPPARNAPCPCGSGKKYKHCCGRNAR